MQTLEHRKQIDGLRFFAFLAVFMIHSDVEHFWWGSYGVSLFFVISGFLITRILIASQDRPRGQALKAFYARRALRIFPAYYLVLGLAAATVGIAYLPAYVLYVMNWGIFFYTWVQPALVDVRGIPCACTASTSGRCASRSSSIWFSRCCFPSCVQGARRFAGCLRCGVGRSPVDSSSPRSCRSPRTG